RDLQHGGAELDPLGCGGQHSESHERIEGRAPAPERVGDPKPGKPALFNAAGVIDDASERPIARLGSGTQKSHHAQSHNCRPIPNPTATSPSSFDRRVAGQQCIDPARPPTAAWFEPTAAADPGLRAATSRVMLSPEQAARRMREREKWAGSYRQIVQRN